MKYKKVVVYDFETTGFWSVLNQPIQVACKIIENGKEEHYFKYIKCPFRLNPAIVDLTGITDEKLLSEGVDMKYVFNDLKEIFSPDSLVVGHNILRFDNLFLNNCMLKTGHVSFKLENKQCFDTAAHFKALLLDRKWDSKGFIGDWHGKLLGTPAKGLKYKLSDAGTHYGHGFSNLHNAIDDVELTHKVFLSQIQEDNT